ncbi:uncharacterized protein LOC109826527 [Asparagus officinalis]|uniref:uncharacterized protein LOC109826527 n=1 Tax=Asparagus officinalis TaxID=4686 RepID=UPI00098DF982|nr:uncharacterized protein LOC109826527 [Asparagus officinalis]
MILRFLFSFVVARLSSQLREAFDALLSDDDPDKLLLCLEVSNFFNFVESLIDKLLEKKIPFRHFWTVLERKIALIKDIVSLNIAKALTDDMNQLERKFVKLQELQFVGVSDYVAARMEVHLQTWRESRASVGLRIQAQRKHVDQAEEVLSERLAHLCEIDSSLASVDVEIAELEQKLAEAKQRRTILEVTKAGEEHSKTVMSSKVALSRERLAKMEEEAAQLLSAYEDSFKIELQRELERTYAKEFAKLEQQIISQKFNVK